MSNINIGISIDLQKLIDTRLLLQAVSGGFNNALARLNTLELIIRESGKIQLNPELLDIQIKN